MTKKSSKEIRQEVTAKIIEALKTGTSPWQRPWDSQGGSMWPHNCATGHNYTGANFPLLMSIQMLENYPTAQWLTFRQARSAGGSVRKGEKASYVIFAKPLMINETQPNGKVEKKKIFFLRQTPVFNVAQCDNVKLPKKEQPPEKKKARKHSAIAASAKAFMKSVGAEVKHGGSRAYYRPSTDHIQMPPLNTFKHGKGYAATAYHELVHWTGHADRCKREMKGTFGDSSYAFEELVAEIGSAMLCHARGVSSEVPNHASYIQSWIKKLESDESYIFKASKLSEQALNFLLPETARKVEKEAA